MGRAAVPAPPATDADDGAGQSRNRPNSNITSANTDAFSCSIADVDSYAHPYRHTISYCYPDRDAYTVPDAISSTDSSHKHPRNTCGPLART